MQPIVEVSHAFIPAIHRQRILSQVIGSDAEEIALGRQRVGRNRGCWDLDHDSHLHVGIKLFAARSHPLPNFRHQGPHFSEFLHTRNHGKKQFRMPRHTGTEYRAKLDSEGPAVLEGEANRPEPELGVLFIRLTHIGDALVSAEV